MYNEETGFYEYGPRFYYDKETGAIFYAAPAMQSSIPYWEEINPYTWPPFAGYTPETSEVIIFEYDPRFVLPGRPDRVNLETGEIIYVDWPLPEAIPEPEETQIQHLQQQLADQDTRLGDVEIMLADVVMGGGD